MRRETILHGAITVTALLLVPLSASAQNAVGIGGRVSATAAFSVTTTAPDDFDDSTSLLLSGMAAYTTENARFELGGGLSVFGVFSTVDASAWVLSAQGRVNSNALGPEENILLYLGGVVGAAFVEFDDANDELGVFGPKAGAEFYMSPNTAIQIEDVLLGDTEGGVTNNLTIGFKLLFQ
ncbi:MAG TPA: hypothetical protein ENI85_10080 [Deltaproteobacteria bacterium]|nr:hypothetical protein [Deltaproteobacteria bacterium]